MSKGEKKPVQHLIDNAPKSNWKEKAKYRIDNKDRLYAEFKYTLKALAEK